MAEALTESTGVAWVVLGTLAAGLLTALLLLADFLFSDDELARSRRRRQLPLVITSDADAERRIRRLLLPTECVGEPDVAASPAAAEAELHTPLRSLSGVGAGAGAGASSSDGLSSPLYRWQQATQSAKQRLGHLGTTFPSFNYKAQKPELKRWAYRPLADDVRHRSGRTPLLIFVNVRSGGQQGRKLLLALRHLFRNEHQVIDMSAVREPKLALDSFAAVPRFRILCCGGDGTVASVLTMLDDVAEERRLLYKPPVGILPLGTGNDLARVLGWGGGYLGGDLLSWLEAVETAEVTLLDRWAVTLTPAPCAASAAGGGKRQRGRGAAAAVEPQQMVRAAGSGGG
jgi:hypothetical protein